RKKIRKQIELIDLKGNSAVIFHSNKTIIVLYFKTNCQFCVDEISSIAENIEKINKTKLFLVSSENQDRITKFASYFKIDKHYFFSDKTGELKNELNVKSCPSIFIFSKEKELIKQFKGVVPIEKIVAEIPNE
ncbi:MAG: redoxin domain-containing protein, partial [Bacteroidales bacterium]|nr:redoxin domain-containing protein [Bacteroidales bacterium]